VAIIEETENEEDEYPSVAAFNVGRVAYNATRPAQKDVNSTMALLSEVIGTKHMSQGTRVAAATSASDVIDGAVSELQAFTHLFEKETATALPNPASGTDHDALSPSAHLPPPQDIAAAVRQYTHNPARAAMPDAVRDMMDEGLAAVMAAYGADVPIMDLVTLPGKAQASLRAAAAGHAGGDSAPAAVPSDAQAGSAASSDGSTGSSGATGSSLGSSGGGGGGSSVATEGQGSTAAGAPAPAAPLPPPLRLAVAQLHPVAGDTAANVDRVGRVLAALAGARGGAGCADLVAFPEVENIMGCCCHIMLVNVTLAVYRGRRFYKAIISDLRHYAPFLLFCRLPRRSKHRVSPRLTLCYKLVTTSCGIKLCDRQAAFALQISKLAAKYRIAVLIPYVERGTQPDPRSPSPSPDPDPEHAHAPLYNSEALIDADGSLAGHYRKCHLWGADYEKKVWTPGPGPVVDYSPVAAAASEAGVPVPMSTDPFTPFRLAAFPHVPIGLLVCFDLEFPEATRILALRGAKLVVAAMASAENFGLTSRRFVYASAAQVLACALHQIYSHFPLHRFVVGAEPRGGGVCQPPVWPAAA
jgi:predicted amidohydrolase